MNTDQEWARELFEASRQGEEPAWVADHAAMIRTGQRRNRVRTLTASGSVLATAAVVAAVGIGVAGGTARRAPDPSPGQSQSVAPTPTKTAAALDPSQVLNYASFDSFSMKDQRGTTDPTSKDFHIAVSATTAHDTMQLLGALDPTLGHIAKRVPNGLGVRLVPDDDPVAQNTAGLGATVLWTDRGLSADDLQKTGATAPAGTLNVSFVDSADEGPAGKGVCVTDGLSGSQMLDPVQTGPHAWTDKALWGPCTKTTLPDGSVLLSAAKNSGSLYLATAARRFPGNGGEVVLAWQNYADATFSPTPGAPPLNAPDPKRALSPNPITLDKLVAALSGTGLTPALAPLPTTTLPPSMLQPSDFGAGWTFNAAGSNARTSTLVVDNGCVNEQHPVAAPRPVYAYSGTTPSGIKVTANAQLDVMGVGSGQHWMADLRQHAGAGCDIAGLPYSKDTMTPLPAGTGDEGFVEDWYGQHSETFFIRFGDVIMRLDITTADQKMPAFTSADKTWFAALAGKAVTRYGAS